MGWIELFKTLYCELDQDMFEDLVPLLGISIFNYFNNGLLGYFLEEEN